MKKKSLDKDRHKDRHKEIPQPRPGAIREKPVTFVSLLSEKNSELFSDPQVAEALDSIIEKNRPTMPASSCESILRRMIAGIKARIAARFRSNPSHRKPSEKGADDATEKSDTCALSR